jgi:hypothetical protein
MAVMSFQQQTQQHTLLLLPLPGASAVAPQSLWVATFEGDAKMLELRQWSGGKLLHGIIARILLCCVGVTDDKTDGRY